MGDTKQGSLPPDDWRVDWESHREAQRERWRAATPAQRLAWLEELIALAWNTGALPRRDEAGGGVETGL
jgi:hypothetical protein